MQLKCRLESPIKKSRTAGTQAGLSVQATALKIETGSAIVKDLLVSVPVCMREPVHVSDVASISQFYEWACGKSAAIGNRFLEEDDGPTAAELKVLHALRAIIVGVAAVVPLSS
jgi:hypothetical protein